MPRYRLNEREALEELRVALRADGIQLSEPSGRPQAASISAEGQKGLAIPVYTLMRAYEQGLGYAVDCVRIALVRRQQVDQ